MELVPTPENPVPTNALVSGVTTVDGVELRVARWKPRGKKRTLGTVVILQGRAEFIEKYFETVAELRQRGFAVVAFDWRGQGGSSRLLANPRKGHVRNFKHYQRDLNAVLHEIVRPYCPEPCFALAHSMGGAILLQRLAAGDTTFTRAVLTAPMVGLALVRRPRLAASLALALASTGFGRAFIPGGGPLAVNTQPFEANRLTSDPVRYARNAGVLAAGAHLGLGDPTVAWVKAAFRAMASFADPHFGIDIRTPMLLIAAASDQVVSTPAIERLAMRLKTARAVVLQRTRHEILMECDEVREAFWAAFDAFVPGSTILPRSLSQADKSLSAAS